MRQLAALLWIAVFACPPGLKAGVTRAEAVAIARSFAEHSWQAAARHVRHGPDGKGVDVQTPDGPTTDGLWTPDSANTGVPYKWGGFDSLASFEAGLRAGKAAGDLYSSEKRRLADTAVSSQAVGVDCSGFISRCWKLRKKYGTVTLGSICKRLGTPAELRAGDIMNQAGGHVLLFSHWLDDAKSRALFYEAHPFSKVIASEHPVPEMVSGGFVPMLYREIAE